MTVITALVLFCDCHHGRSDEFSSCSSGSHASAFCAWRPAAARPNPRRSRRGCIALTSRLSILRRNSSADSSCFATIFLAITFAGSRSCSSLSSGVVSADLSSLCRCLRRFSCENRHVRDTNKSEKVTQWRHRRDFPHHRRETCKCKACATRWSFQLVLPVGLIRSRSSSRIPCHPNVHDYCMTLTAYTSI
eukprot:SAG25_NODE_2885_length_1334_cov_1.418623_2_plen_191_part_00